MAGGNGAEMKRRLPVKSALAGLLLGCCMSLGAYPALSGAAQISLLTCSPSNKAAYTLYGHSALRVCDPGQSLDVVFNYGIFDFSKPNFIWRFARGETDYMLAYCAYSDFLADYVMRGSGICEQTLNLNRSEKESLWQALLRNAEPQRRVYRYSFFFDNCATRPVAMLERCMEGRIVFSETATSSFRDMINHCTRHHPWLTFGCDLVLGMPTDRQATFRESFFLPENVRKAFGSAQRLRADGAAVPLVVEERMLLEDIEDDEPARSPLTPLACSLLILAIVLALTLYEWRTKRRFRVLDSVLFSCAALAGCLLFFLCFASVHPGIWPNLTVLWLHPFHFAGAVLCAVKKRSRAAYCWHFINFAALLLMCVGWIILPQHVNVAFIPLVSGFMIRSGFSIIRK
jgi:hypothetical protein